MLIKTDVLSPALRALPGPGDAPRFTGRFPAGGPLRSLRGQTKSVRCGAHKDRHEVIGGGYIGLEALRQVVWHPALAGLPMVLETPNELSGYAAEIRLLRENVNTL